MRLAVDETKLRAFMGEVGRRATGPGRVYLVGGATALLLHFREQTVDIDIKLDPEPQGVFEAIATAKEKLEVNVELAAQTTLFPLYPAGGSEVNSSPDQER